MRRICLACFAAVLAAPALAAPAEIAGTWECRQPGVQYHNKPPILYFTEAPGAPSEISVEVDGFSREVYGKAELTQDKDGWWTVKPAKGQEFSVRPEAAGKQRTAAMALRWPEAKSDYRCLRLPASVSRPVTTPSAGAENAPGTLSVPPSGAAAPGAATPAPEAATPAPEQKEPEKK